MEPKPSISIWIDPDTQMVKTDFRSQKLSPAEYGIVLASLLVHIARLFADSNPRATEDDIIAELQKGIAVGLSQRKDFILPQKSH